MTHEPTPAPAEHAPSRRAFLTTAAMVAGAGALISCAGKGAKGGSASATSPVPLAKPRVPAEDGRPVRIGIIGTGGMGTGHVSAYHRLHKNKRENVQIVALADVNDLFVQRARAICQKEAPDVSVETYRDYRHLIARDDIHGVLIASPEHWHADHAIDALLAGKDVYLEKPMTLDLPDALRLRRVVQANPELIMQVGTQYAAQPKYLEAKKLIESGALGPALWSQCSYCRNTPKGEWNYYALDDKWQPGVNLDWEAWCGSKGKRPWDPKVYIRWRRYRDFSTGIVGDLLVHEMTPIFAAINTCGWPVRVAAMGAHHVDKQMENHDQVNLTVQFESGHTMIVAGNTNNEFGLEKVIRCQKGNIYLNSRHCVVRPERAWESEVDEKTIHCPDVGDDQDQHRVNWLKCIRTREKPFSDIEQGTKVMVCVDLATRAMWEGGSWSFDPKTMKASRA